MHGETKVPRVWIAFFLGVLSFFLLFIGEPLVENVGEALGTVVAFILLAAYFFICQFRLSRGNPNALRKDWPIMLALDAVPLLMVLITALVEKWPVILFSGSRNSPLLLRRDIRWRVCGFLESSKSGKAAGPKLF